MCKLAYIIALCAVVVLCRETSATWESDSARDRLQDILEEIMLSRNADENELHVEKEVYHEAVEVNDASDDLQHYPIESSDSLQASVQQGAGVVYIRWGATACPSVSGTTTVYTGRAAGVYFDERGGGSNYLCYPDTPETPPSINAHYTRDDSFIAGTRYQHPINSGSHGRAVPCASCFVSTRFAQLMIPATTRCPRGWTVEYIGYIMSDGHWGDRSRNEFVCVDSSQTALAQPAPGNQGALLYHVRVHCPQGDIRCAASYPVAVTCVVCSR